MKTLLAVPVLAALIVCAAPAASAGERQPDRIVYLYVTLDGGGVHFDSLDVVPGKLKTRRRLRLAPGHLYVSLTSTSGEMLYEGTVDDPSILRVEYVDADGELGMKTARRDVTRFAIRIPYHDTAHRVSVHRIAARDAGGSSAPVRGESIGSFQIDFKGAADAN